MSHYLWSALNEDWNLTEEYWWIIEEIIAGGGAGGGPDEWFGAYQKLDKKKKRKIIHLIMTRNGIKFEQTKEVKVDEYNVTAEDIAALVEEHLEYKKMKVKISDVKMDTDESTWG